MDEHTMAEAVELIVEELQYMDRREQQWVIREVQRALRRRHKHEP